MDLTKKISITDIRGPELYAGFRDELRKRIIELKRHRRVIVGDLVSMVFENRHTLIFQIEEMLRVEGIRDPAKVQEEIDVYNELMPTADSLSATLFIELPQGADKRAELGRLVGLDEHVVLHIGEHAVRAAFEPGRSEADRISAVQYTRYPLSAVAKRALCTPGTRLAIEIDHPSYAHRVELPESTRASLAADDGN
jgi:hypothetical protein